MNKTIYDLTLHEELHINPNTIVTRVPAGWLYTIYRLDSNAMTTAFVPFDNKFQKVAYEESEVKK